jgi:hypothetical protein
VSEIVSLSVLEGRKLMRQPVVLGGVGVAVAGLGGFILRAGRGSAVSWHNDGWTVWIGVALLGLFTMVGANHAALRDHRERTVEQHHALPMGPRTRTGALLLATVWPGAAGAVLLAGAVGYALSVGRVEAVDMVQLAALVGVIVMFGAMGVAIARWAPKAFLAPLLAWGFVFWTPGDHPSAWHVLSPLAHPETVTLAAWHIAYVLALTSIWCALAVLRDGGRRFAILAGIGGVAMVVVSIGYLLPRVCPFARACLL